MLNLNGKKPCISLLTFRKQGKEHVYMTAQKKRQVTADYLRKGEGEFVVWPLKHIIIETGYLDVSNININDVGNNPDLAFYILSHIDMQYI